MRKWRVQAYEIFPAALGDLHLLTDNYLHSQKLYYNQIEPVHFSPDLWGLFGLD